MKVVLNVFLIWLFIISLKALVNTILKKTICVCVFFFFFLAEQNYHVLKLFSKMPLVLKLDFNKIEFCVNSISSKSSFMYFLSKIQH